MFLSGSAAGRVTMLRAVPRAMAASAPRAAFSATVTMQKSIAQSAKDSVTNAAQRVNHAVGDTVVSGIDLGTAALRKAKDIMPDKGIKKKMEGKAGELSGQAREKASEAAGEVKEEADKMAGKAERAAENMK